MSQWPPGIPFLLRHTVPLLHSLLRYCLPSIATPVHSRIVFGHWCVARSAKCARVILPPRWIGESFGHLDVLSSMMHSLDHGYPGL
ncbi:uncharacterized protein LAESUDRAFT_726743 [Laetiporus sulphureus 93-53]|uniref:Secreted protein n=1 Tax=Laetiporus sulphureus 93-53 TaxID=1314785 RepID=A0A165DWT6_9APHY|nr:uncharacterized protein LAESUDRAFT_726743 [Laetiporus sulphureus 93-53]KZT05790.1 hypothetical protein LAESUDRAFT_726743 [Laetiporus sulphureus 93-53]